MLIVGYCYGISSERQLCEELRLNLAYRRFCRLSIEDAVPDHSDVSTPCGGKLRVIASIEPADVIERIVTCAAALV